MRIRLLGTGAGYGIPAMFCDCRVCRAARDMGGAEVRTRTGALIDGALKIDFSTDTYVNTLTYEIDLVNLHHVLITHVHADHLNPHELSLRCGPFANLPDDAPVMNVYAPPELASEMHYREGRIAVRGVAPFETFDAGGYAVTPCPAEHAAEGGAYNYLIERSGAAIYYALDSGRFSGEVMDYLAGRGIDLFVLDAALGTGERHCGHMTFGEISELRAELMASGGARPGATFVLSHINHTSGMLGAEIQAAMPDFVVARDGMTITVGEAAI